ncbi:MAG: hypothetical protein AB8E15_07415 [Bdellovibrionales bacterium]
MKSIILSLTISLFTSLAMASQVDCAFITKGEIDHKVMLTHVDEGNGHSITPFDNEIFSGFISFGKGYTVVFLQEKSTKHPVSFNGYTAGEAVIGGIVYSKDIKTTLEFRCD